MKQTTIKAIKEIVKEEIGYFTAYNIKTSVTKEGFEVIIKHKERFFSTIEIKYMLCSDNKYHLEHISSEQDNNRLLITGSIFRAILAINERLEELN